MSVMTIRPILLMCCAFISTAALGAGGPLGIDHRLTFDESGIWSRPVQNASLFGVMGLVLADAAWEGSESRLGRTSWYAIDSGVLGGLAVTGLKRVFGRVRPRDTADPNEWFKGSTNQSFPSGEVTAMTA